MKGIPGVGAMVACSRRGRLRSDPARVRVHYFASTAERIPCAATHARIR